jgi:hypothetical protein
MVGSWRLFGHSKGLASRGAMPGGLLPSRAALFGAPRLRRRAWGAVDFNNFTMRFTFTTNAVSTACNRTLARPR